MPRVVFRKGGEVFADEVAGHSNLVVRTGVRRFPFPHLTFGCGMGKCGKCACRVIQGAEHLPQPNWKETTRLGERIAQGYRLICQLWIDDDIELEQDDALNAAAVREMQVVAAETKPAVGGNGQGTASPRSQ